MLHEYAHFNDKGEIAFSLREMHREFMRSVPLRGKKVKADPSAPARRVTPTVWFSYKRKRLFERSGIKLYQGIHFEKIKRRGYKIDYLIDPVVAYLFIRYFPREMLKPNIADLYEWLYSCGHDDTTAPAPQFIIVPKVEIRELEESGVTRKIKSWKPYPTIAVKQSPKKVSKKAAVTNRERFIKELNGLLADDYTPVHAMFSCFYAKFGEPADSRINTDEEGYADVLSVINGLMRTAGIIDVPIKAVYKAHKLVRFE